ncbi:MAG: MBL fold metallo-hydrolase [Duncaniella sp.]|nr:MBL fold metallo-hydrolase [Duncaniella sp.]
MARRKIQPRSPMPGLFDAIENFQERIDGDFKIIPPDEMEQIVKAHAEKTPLGSIDAAEPAASGKKAVFMSFGSGSSGNCYYVGTPDEGILVDAGVDFNVMGRAMRDNGLSFGNVKGIILTHDHGDHIRYAYGMLRKYKNIGLYCTPRVLNGILRRHNVSRRIKDFHHPIYKEFPFKLAGMEITPFEVKHDGTDNAGFYIDFGSTSLTIATDLGEISDRPAHYLRQSRAIVIESNYDRTMLDEGPYPAYLKARIISGTGHLDNRVTADFVAGMYSEKLSHVFLCHLSHENNTPELALETMTRALADVGVTRIGDGLNPLTEGDVQLCLVALPRTEVTPLYLL